MRMARFDVRRVALATVLVLAACAGDGDSGGGPEEDAATADAPAAPESGAAAESAAAAGLEETGAAASGYAAIDVTNGGSIRGAVRFTGEVPPPRSVQVGTDAEACGSTRRVRTVRVGAGGGLADAVVSLTDIREGRAFSLPSPPTLDQEACRFRPHVLIAPVGEPVRVTNSDPFTHNVHTAAFDNRSVNRAQPADLESIELHFDAPEKVRVKCDIHPWMGAWIVVARHPYHAVTDEAGGFRLPEIPPGTYTVEVWHETLGTRTRAVTVEAGRTIELSVDLAGEG